MLSNLGLFLSLLIPFFESEMRGLAFFLLLLSSILIGTAVLKIKVKFDLIDWLLFLFLVVSLGSTIFSWSFSRSFTELIRYLSYFLIIVSLRRLDAVGRKNFARLFSRIMIISAILLSFISFIYLSPYRILPNPTGGMHLFYPTFGHNHLAGLLLFVIPLSISQYLETEKRKWAVATLFFLFSLIFTYSRIAYLLVIISLALLLLKKSSKLLILLVFFLLFFYLFLRIYSYTGKKLDILPWQFYKPIIWENVRVNYWRQAWEGFKLSPILGTGLDTFRYVSKRFSENTHNISWYAHNHFLQLFTETGVLGGGLFFILIVLLFWKIMKYNRYDHYKNYTYPLILGLTGSILNNLFDYDWQFLSLFLYFWIALAIFIPRQEEEGRKSIASSYIIRVIIIVLILALTTFTLGKFSLSLSKIYFPIPLAYKISSLLIPWNAEHQQEIAEIALTYKQYDFVRRYNDKAQKLDPSERNFKLFRSYLESGLEKEEIVD